MRYAFYRQILSLAKRFFLQSAHKLLPSALPGTRQTSGNVVTGLAPVRFVKKIPSTSSEVSMSEILVGLMRMRQDKGNTNLDSPFFQLLKKLLHCFAQKAEVHLEKKLLAHCPDPQVGARIHPFCKTSRLKGNKCLQQSLIGRFTARGGGFVSLKDTTLESMGILKKGSNLATRTTAEFSTRILMKSAERMEESISQSKTINFCFDAAHVSEEHVPWIKYIDKYQLLKDKVIVEEVFYAVTNTVQIF